ncbi:hypothetical protein HanIR_Chr16g0813321 [Helianthus annuus]|nr:hypothetical protein HanIR_Chr16g0813321 [Helianthus annuus]
MALMATATESVRKFRLLPKGGLGGTMGKCHAVIACFSRGLVHQLFTNLKLSWMKIIQE